MMDPRAALLSGALAGLMVEGITPVSVETHESPVHESVVTMSIELPDGTSYLVSASGPYEEKGDA